MKFTDKVYWIAILIVPLLTGCASQNSALEQPVETVRYTIEMSEFVFSPNTIDVKVGQEVTLELVNTGALEHELMIGRQVKVTDRRPDGYHSEMFTTLDMEPMVMGGSVDPQEMGHGHGGEHTGFMLTLPVGTEKASLTFRVTEEMLGEWEIGCFSQLGVHYDAGMKGKFIVTR